MNKAKKNPNIKSKLYTMNSRLILSSCLITIFISFIIRFKDFIDLPAYENIGMISNATNLFTYYKLVGMSLMVFTLIVFWGYLSYHYKIKIRTDYVLYGCSLIIFGAIIALLFNPTGHMQLIGFFTRTNGLLAYIVLYLFIYVISNLTVNGKTLDKINVYITIFVIVATTIGLFQFFGYDIYNQKFFRELIFPSQMAGMDIKNNIVGSAAFSLFSHYNYYSGFCSIFFPFMIVLAVSERMVKRRVLFSISSVLLFLGVVTSISQSGAYTTLIMLILVCFGLINKKNWKMMGALCGSSIILGVGLAIYLQIQTYKELGPKITKYVSNPRYLLFLLFFISLFCLAIYIRKYAEQHKKVMLKAIIIICFICLLFGLFFLLNNVVENHKHMFTDRGYVWFHTYELIKKSPVIGYGPDNFYYAFPQNNSDASNYSGGQAFDKPHNMFLQIYMDTGIVGFIGFIGLLLFYMLALVKSDQFYEESSTGTFMKGSLFMIIAYMLQGMVNDNHLTIQPILFFIIGVGMSVAKGMDKPNNIHNGKVD